MDSFSHHLVEAVFEIQPVVQEWQRPNQLIEYFSSETKSNLPVELPDHSHTNLTNPQNKLVLGLFGQKAKEVEPIIPLYN